MLFRFQFRFVSVRFKLEKDIAKQSGALAQATAIRNKENAEFAADEQDLTLFRST